MVAKINKEETLLIIEFLKLECIESYPYSKAYKLWCKIVPNVGIEEYGNDSILRYKDECSDYEMKFHLSWDWLMYVVEKIEELGAEVSITSEGSYIEMGGEWSNTACGNVNCDFEAGCSDNTKINNTYTVVIEFIEWYNKKISENER